MREDVVEGGAHPVHELELEQAREPEGAAAHRLAGVRPSGAHGRRHQGRPDVAVDDGVPLVVEHGAPLVAHLVDGLVGRDLLVHLQEGHQPPHGVADRTGQAGIGWRLRQPLRQPGLALQGQRAQQLHPPRHLGGGDAAADVREQRCREDAHGRDGHGAADSKNHFLVAAMPISFSERASTCQRRRSA